MENNKNLCYVINLFVKKLEKIIETYDIPSLRIKELEDDEFNNKIKIHQNNLLCVNKKINELIESLVDVCIKHKIYYYINKNISYSSIKNNFKNELYNFLHELFNKENKNIENFFNYIKEEDLEEYSDLQSLFFNKFKNNKVKFSNTVTEHHYDNDNVDTVLNDNSCITLDNKTSIYIKMLFNNPEYINMFVEKITEMCFKLYDKNVDYCINETN